VDLATFVSRLATRLNINANDSLYSSLDDYVNEALHYLETSASDGYPWYRQTLILTTTANVQSYAFTILGSLVTPPVAVRKILDAKVRFGTTYQPLDLISPETADQSYGERLGFPTAWYAEGQALYLYPTPDAVYTVKVRVVYMEPDLVEMISTPVLPVVFHGAVLDAALLTAYQQLQDTPRAETQEKKVALWVQRMRQGDEYTAAPRITVRDPLVV
jgi:hypothetical protein